MSARVARSNVNTDGSSQILKSRGITERYWNEREAFARASGIILNNLIRTDTVGLKLRLILLASYLKGHAKKLKNSKIEKTKEEEEKHEQKKDCFRISYSLIIWVWFDTLFSGSFSIPHSFCRRSNGCFRRKQARRAKLKWNSPELGRPQSEFLLRAYRSPYGTLDVIYPR